MDSGDRGCWGCGGDTERRGCTWELPGSFEGTRSDQCSPGEPKRFGISSTATVFDASAVGSSASSLFATASAGPAADSSSSFAFLEGIKEGLGDVDRLSDLGTKYEEIGVTMGDNRDNLANDVEGDVDINDSEGDSDGRTSCSGLRRFSVLQLSTEEMVVGSSEAGMGGGSIGVVDTSGPASVKSKWSARDKIMLTYHPLPCYHLLSHRPYH